MLARQRDPIVDVRDDDCRAFSGIEIMVRVDTSRRLVLDEKYRVHRLAHIMEQRAHAREQGVCADQLRGLLGKVRHLQAVLIRPRRVAQKELQQ